MATETSSQSETSNSSEDNPDRLKLLYPAVDEEETPLPRTWSPKDKFSFIGLSQNNLRVHYKGTGKSHKDAASVRATHPIPASCGIYYFEVKVISKGRDGYMGIGLSTQGVSMNRLPGWDKQAYGYHGDDGNSFCSSGAGQPYGPTFTTGDTIGCCLNLIDKTCFYTKNGVSLGVAFTDLPANLYPTVGLQTPGEVVEANFGQTPFLFDIMDYMKEWRMKTKQAIERFSVSDKKGEFQSALQKIVSTYLVHHGYCSAAEAFSKSTGEPIMESIESIRNRQRIQKLVLAGRMGEAIETTQKLYPHLLETKPDLLFMLKCRQFVEMVNGTDSEVRGSRTSTTISPSSNICNSSSGPVTYSNNIHSTNSSSHGRSPKSHFGGGDSTGSNRSSPAHSPHPYHRSSTPPSSSLSQHHHSHHQQQQQQQHHHHHTSPSSRTTPTNSACNSPNRPCSNSNSSNSKTQGRQSPSISSSSSSSVSTTATVTTTQALSLSTSSTSNLPPTSSPQQHLYSNNSVNGNSVTAVSLNNNNRLDNDNCESSMNSSNANSINEFTTNKSAFPSRYIQDADGDDVDMVSADKSPITNGTTPIANGGTDSHTIDEDEDMDVDAPPSNRPLMCGGNEVAIEKMLAFGRDLKMMSQRLRKDYGKNEANKKTLQDAFSLLAYSDPWNSPIGSQLLPVKREPVCAALNSAILESKGLPKQPPLELALSQASQCVRLMARSGIGSCAFASISEYLH